MPNQTNISNALVLVGAVCMLNACASSEISVLSGSKDSEAENSKETHEAIKHALNPKKLSPLPDRFETEFWKNPRGQWVSNLATDNALTRLCKKHDPVDIIVNGGELSAQSLTLLKDEPLKFIIFSSLELKVPEIKVISSFKGLKRLEFRGVYPFDDEMAYALTGPSSLKELELRRLELTDKGIAKLAENLPRLKKLTLRECKMVKSLEPFSKFQNLKYLAIMNGGIESPDFTCLKKLPRLENIRVSSISTNSGDFDCLGSFSSLTHLDLSGNPIQDNHLYMLSKLKKLKSLNIENCKLLTKEAIVNFKRNRPNCTLNI